MSISYWQQGLPYQLPLLKEIQAGILEKRGKRKRDGKFYDTEDRPTPKSLALRVRGHDLQVMNDPRKLLLNLTQPAETMSWFVVELWKDLHPAPIGDIAPDAPGGRPAEEIAPAAPGGRPADEPAAADGEESKAADRADFEEHLQSAVNKTLLALRQHEAIRSVSWDKTYGRFRIWLEEGGSKAKYAPVKNTGSLSNMRPWTWLL